MSFDSTAKVAAGEPATLPASSKRHPPYLGGVASMMSVCITHPIDQSKVRLQTQTVRRGMIATARRTIAREGVTGLWTGLSGSLVRQATYGATRFGVYAMLNDREKRARASARIPRTRLIRNGAIAGIFAGILGAPGELVMVRMCADGVKPEASRLNYPSALHGLWRIAREEGLAKCFRGIGPTVLRSVIMNASQLSCYDMIKEALLGTGRIADGVPLHLLTSALGGTVAVTLVAPVDVMKSRIQSSTEGATAAQIVARSLRNEGVAVLFRGWAPAWLRMAPTTMLTFMFFEQLKKIF